jgi:coatomer subunit beta'
MFLLGYIPSHNRVYLADKDVNIYGYTLSLSVVEYQTAVLRDDMPAAAEILPTIPKEQLNKVARFLEGRGKYQAVTCWDRGIYTCSNVS